ncbi:hypothetical protein C8A03DRAFT_42226 [Achaetomium macrosporum]|uniref:Uncharacterized protein n=1 Tax=Achaetomium macrosporum TaxID=79813 RepID=A0AAN7HCY1_9PEZI|nr:hypothetical protein C8A03DRAFT_42226 [Achaetomium macrosporum]
MSHLLKGKSKSRDPPPTLFHNPSPSASHASLSIPGPGSKVPPQPFASAFTSPTPATTTTAPQAGGSSRTTTGGLNINIPLSSTKPSLQRGSSRATTDRTDALWAEMQATLEAVELSAAAAARVFGPDHERKLDELRAAQIALAQAWARSEADEAIETTAGGGGGGALGGGGGGAGEGGMMGGGISEGRSVATDVGGGAAGGGGRSTVGTGSVAAARPGSSGVGIGGGQQERLGVGVHKMEEETEADILLARKRREANDRYFQRVNQGVLDVVAKLEEVALAMRAVEQESKELWGDENESAPASAKA